MRPLFAVAALAMTPLHAQQTAPAPAPVPPVNPLAAAEAESRAAPPPTARVRYGADAMREGELRIPAGKGRFPVVMLIHGGCWQNTMGGRDQIAAVAEALRRRGIAVWNVEYRRVGDPGGGWPGTFQDIAAAADYLPVLAKRYPLDLARVSFVRHSAGAHLAAWAAARSKLPPPWRSDRVRPVSMVVIDGPVALTPFVGADAEVCGKPVIVPLMGTTPTADPARYAAASAADHRPLGIRELYVLAALGPLMQSDVAAAKATPDRVETLTPPDANHFDVVTPSTRNGAAVVDFIAAKAFAR